MTDLIIPDPLKWADEMVEVRNGLAHEADHQAGQFDVLGLTMSTTYLLYLVLMTHLGFSDAEQRAAIQDKL